MNDFKEADKFDETYKLLLSLLTVMISFAIGFFKETITELSFSLLSLYVASVALWAIPNFLRGRLEYSVKLVGWYFLILSLFSAYIRITLQTLIIWQPFMTYMSLGSAAIFFVTLFYLRNYVYKWIVIPEAVLVALLSLAMIFAIQ